MVVSLGAATILTPWLITLAAAGGYASHLAADACTKAGVPLFWPVAIREKRWWNIRFLGSAVTSGTDQEKAPAVGVAVASNLFLLFMYL
jgi:membrane-bound metal-dependent hydrolase YbcI (DUF457 family)